MNFLLGLTLLIIVVVVVCPAVWSRKKTRRDAALAALDRIFRRQASAPDQQRSGAKAAPSGCSVIDAGDLDESPDDRGESDAGQGDQVELDVD